MMLTRTLRLALPTLAAGALVLTACGGDDEPNTETTNGDTPAAEDLGLIEEGVISVCSDLPYAVFEFEDADAPSGYSGFDIDLMQEIADRLELDLEVLPTSFDAIESGSAMAADQCDVAASAMSITEDRTQNINFSDPYFDAIQSLLLPTDSELSSLEDFGEGTTLGTQGATTGEEYAQENAPDGTEVAGLADDQTLRQAIESGQIDGILQDLPTNETVVEELDGYEVVETYETDEQYGFGAKAEGKEALIEAINTHLGDMRDDGKYDEIHEKYFDEE